MVEEINAVLGTDMTGDEMVELGGEILRRERAFNEAAGSTKADDRLLEFMYHEALPPHNVVVELSTTSMTPSTASCTPSFHSTPGNPIPGVLPCTSILVS